MPESDFNGIIFFEGRHRKPFYYCPTCDLELPYNLKSAVTHLRSHGYQPDSAVVIEFSKELVSLFDDTEDSSLGMIFSLLIRKILRVFEEPAKKPSKTLGPHALDWPKTLEAEYLRLQMDTPHKYLFNNIMAIESGNQRWLQLPSLATIRALKRESRALQREATEQEAINEIVNRKLDDGVDMSEVSPLDKSEFSQLDALNVLDSRADHKSGKDTLISSYVDTNPAPDPLGRFGLPKDKKYRGSNPKRTIKINPTSNK